MLLNLSKPLSNEYAMKTLASTCLKQFTLYRLPIGKIGFQVDLYVVEKFCEIGEL